MNKLDRIVAIILAALIGCAAVALALLIVAKGLGIGGGGILYVVVLLGAGGGSYGFCMKLVKRIVWVRWPVIALVVIGIAYLSINYKNLGFEDPFVPIILVILPIAFLYMFIPDTSKSVENPASTSTNIEELKLKGNVEGLVAVQNSSTDWMRCLDAAEALAQMGDPRGIDYLNEAVENNDSEIRDIAKEILEGLKDHQPA